MAFVYCLDSLWIKIANFFIKELCTNYSIVINLAK